MIQVKRREDVCGCVISTIIVVTTSTPSGKVGPQMKGNPRKIHLALEGTTELTVIINVTRVVNYDQLTLGISLIMTINDTRVVNSDTQPGGHRHHFPPCRPWQNGSFFANLPGRQGPYAPHGMVRSAPPGSEPPVGTPSHAKAGTFPCSF